jgi:hypothetical protein
MPAWLDSEEGFVPGCKLLPSHCILTCQKKNKNNLPFIKALISFLRPTPLHILMVPSPTNIKLKINIQHVIFEGGGERETQAFGP